MIVSELEEDDDIMTLDAIEGKLVSTSQATTFLNEVIQWVEEYENEIYYPVCLCYIS